MSIQQVWFEIPEPYGSQLAAGTATRFGSVVRNGSRIVAHLKEVPPPAEVAEDVLGRALRVLWSKKALIVIGIVVLVVVGALLVLRTTLKLVRRRRAKRAERAVSNAQVAYLAAIRERRMTPEVVSGLASALDELEARVTGARLDVDGEPPSDLRDLAQLACDYGTELALANNVTALRDPSEDLAGLSTRQLIERLRAELAMQRDLWTAA